MMGFPRLRTIEADSQDSASIVFIKYCLIFLRFHFQNIRQLSGITG